MAEKGSFRERGYRMAAGRLRNYPDEVKKREDLKKLRGIGDSCATKIVEIIRTGASRFFPSLTRECTDLVALCSLLPLSLRSSDPSQ
jgi:DNA polymerase/3'-5' exonuclease PolX